MNQDIKSLKALLKRARYQETVYQCYRMNRKDNEIIEHTALNKHFLEENDESWDQFCQQLRVNYSRLI